MDEQQRASRRVAYYRVSTELQGTHGLGMAARREAVRLYGERNGYPIVAAYEEVETGRRNSTTHRRAIPSTTAKLDLNAPESALDKAAQPPVYAPGVGFTIRGARAIISLRAVS